MNFRNHAYELHYRHHPQVLIIVEPRIVEEGAQAVINTLPYTHSWRVELIGFFGSICYYGTRVPPSKWTYSPTMIIVSMHL